MKIDKDKVLFLLGGHDLEMITIRDILDEHDIQYFDESQKWGAKLSDYSKKLEENRDKQFYAVELTVDDKSMLEKYNIEIIDHHNEYSYKDASILQVLNILKIELDDDNKREYELVAANDVNHIVGMKCVCATKHEIDRIRKKDRKIQGVTDKQEERAREEIRSVKKEGNIFVIKSSLDTFTPIVDFYENRPLLVYSENDLMFYGDITYIKEEYSTQIKNNEAFHGLNYFGFTDAYLISTNVKNSADNIIKILNKDENTIYSYHTFMLPFVFKGNFKKETNWKYEQFKITESRDYNEQVYFYKHVQEALFNFNEESDNDNKEFISSYYEYMNQKGTYSISCKKGDYSLNLDGISLRIFNTGVAILSFNLINTKYRHKNDILAINDFGRRVYPQFLGSKDFTNSTKNAILAKCLTLSLEGEKPIVENFSYFNKIENLQSNHDRLPNFIEYLIKDNFDSITDIRPIIDDRMFVISQYHNDALVENYKVYCDDKYGYEEDDWWYKYVFVDGDDKTCQSKHMTKKFIQESTYDRWVEWGTLFGVSRYSFVAVTGSWYGKNILLPHMQTIYFQMFTLLLAYRASLIKFSDAIQDTTQKETSDIAEETQKLYKKYLDFLNKLYFKEITAQDQGIELYQKAMEVMNIEKFISDLDSEINELHNYVSMKIQEDETKQSEAREKRLENISKLGAVFLPPSLIAGIFGMNVFDFNQSGLSIILVLIFMVLSSILGYFLITNSEKNDKKKTNVKALNREYIGLIGLVFISIILLYFSYASPNNAQDVNIKNQNTIMQKVVNYFNKLQNNKGEKNETKRTK